MHDENSEIPAKDSQSPIPWGTWITRCLLGYTVLAPTIAVICGNNTGATILGAVGAATLLLTRLSDIQKFALFGLKAELRDAVREANATIDQLRDLALSLAEPNLNYMAMHNVMLMRLTSRTQYENKEKIVTALRKLKIPESKIQEASSLWVTITLRKMSYTMLHRLQELKIDAKFNDEVRLTDGQPSPAATLKAFFATNGINDPKLLQLLSDYDHLARTGELRRPEVIDDGQQP